MSQIFRSSSGS